METNSKEKKNRKYAGVKKQFIDATFIDGRKVYIDPTRIARFFDGLINGTNAPCCVVVLDDGRSLAVLESADTIFKKTQQLSNK